MEYVFTFLEGFASFISPCLLPMLPIYISYFAGKEEQNVNKKVINTIGFVLGFTIVFMALSMFASTFGKLIGQNVRYIKIVFGIIVILLGCNYMGIFHFQFLNKTKTLKASTNDLTFFKSLLFGIAFSISWTPCIGTFFSSALLLISRQQDVVKGILLILLYSIGLGIPFIASVILIDKLQKTFQFIKKHYSMVTRISGIILMMMGLYIIFY